MPIRQVGKPDAKAPGFLVLYMHGSGARFATPFSVWSKSIESIVFRINLWNVILVVLCYTKPIERKGCLSKLMKRRISAT